MKSAEKSRTRSYFFWMRAATSVADGCAGIRAVTATTAAATSSAVQADFHGGCPPHPISFAVRGKAGRSGQLPRTPGEDGESRRGALVSVGNLAPTHSAMPPARAQAR